MSSILLQNCTIIDGTGAVLEKGGIFVEGSTIKSVGREKSLPSVAPEASVFDLDGGTVLPGLINLEVHLHRRYLHRWDKPFRFGTPRLDALLDGQRVAWSIKNAWAELIEGTTTFRELGSRNALNNQVRWVFQSGLFNGPRILSVGQGIAITAGYGTQEGEWLAADGPDEVRRAVRLQLRLGADSIKLLAGGALAGMPIYGDPRFTEMDIEECQVAVHEAHKRRRTVVAHAYYPDTIQICVRAGVDCIEHGSGLDEETVDMMAQAGTFYVPTMSGMYQLYKREEEVGDAPAYTDFLRRLVIEPHRNAVATAHRAGVRIATGTDTMGQMVQELEMLHAVGIPAMECIRAATSVASEVLGLQHEVGTLEAGKRADMVVVKGNPLDDLGVLRKVTHVFKDGNHVTPAWLVGKIQDAAAAMPGLYATTH